MHWAEDGRIQITRNFAIGTAAAIVGLALLAMFLIGMLVAGDGENQAQEMPIPTPKVMADETAAETPASSSRTTGQENTRESNSKAQTGTRAEYSTCLVRTYKMLALDVQEARFTPWKEYGSDKSVWDVIRYRHIDYIGDHCQNLAPPPSSTYSETCIPRELQSFYRRNIPEGADNDNFRAIAAEYALTICRPSAER